MISEQIKETSFSVCIISKKKIMVHEWTECGGNGEENSQEFLAAARKGKRKLALLDSLRPEGAFSFCHKKNAKQIGLLPLQD